MTAYFCLLFGARSCTKEERQRQQPEKMKKKAAADRIQNITKQMQRLCIRS